MVSPDYSYAAAMRLTLILCSRSLRPREVVGQLHAEPGLRKKPGTVYYFSPGFERVLMQPVQGKIVYCPRFFPQPVRLFVHQIGQRLASDAKPLRTLRDR